MGNIEEVGYHIIGEELKEGSNVIDYNIREEQTKDAFAVSNANNQTTTGIASDIPGVNAPKLIASTSIIGDSGGVMPLSDLTVTSTSDTTGAQKVLDYVLAGKTFVVLYPVGSSYLVRHLDYINSTSGYIRFYRVYDQTNYLKINYNTSTLVVTSIEEAH